MCDTTVVRAAAAYSPRRPRWTGRETGPRSATPFRRTPHARGAANSTANLPSVGGKYTGLQPATGKMRHVFSAKGHQGVACGVLGQVLARTSSSLSPIKPLPGTAVRVRATLSIDPLAGIGRSLRCETSRPVQLGRQRCALSRGPAMARCTGRRSTSSARRLTGQPWFVSPRHLDPHGWRADCSRSRTAGVPQNCTFAVN